MSKFENLSKEIWVIAIGIVQYLLGGVDTWLKALLILMALDIVTGLIKAAYGASDKSIKGYIDSTVMWQGGIKKLLTLVVICVSTILSYLITPDTMAVRIVTISYYVAEEALSVLENISVCGPKPPGFLLRILEKLQTNAENIKNNMSAPGNQEIIHKNEEP